MSKPKSTSSSFWPTTPSEHRLWWENNASEGVEYGCCWCGCGEQTELAKYTQRLREWLRYCPKKFLHRHATNAQPRVDFGVNRNDGLCHCGCDQPAPIATGTDRRFGLVKGEPVRYINGHHIQDLSYSVEDRGYVTPCWIWHNQTGRGYGGVTINGTWMLAHRYMYEEAKGPVPAGLVLDHLCAPFGGPRRCVNPEHLEPVIQTENMRRAKTTKLTLHDARKIRHLTVACGLSYEHVGKLYGVTPSNVSAIVRGVSWNEGR